MFFKICFNYINIYIYFFLKFIKASTTQVFSLQLKFIHEKERKKYIYIYMYTLSFTINFTTLL
jgi:hypothetical protein